MVDDLDLWDATLVDCTHWIDQLLACVIREVSPTAVSNRSVKHGSARMPVFLILVHDFVTLALAVFAGLVRSVTVMVVFFSGLG